VADEIICASTPEPFFGVGYWYEDFSQTSDEEVHDLLALSRQANPLEEANNQ
jgi:putative phosphoribosyl transferase